MTRFCNSLRTAIAVVAVTFAASAMAQVPPAGDSPYFRMGTNTSGGGSNITTPLALVDTGLPTGPWMLSGPSVAVSHGFAATGGTPPYTFSVETASNFAFSSPTVSSGMNYASGSFGAVGDYPAKVVVRDAAGAQVDTGVFQISVMDQSSNGWFSLSGSVPSETLTLPSFGGIDRAYPLSVSGGTPPYTLSVVKLKGATPLAFADAHAADNTLAGTFTAAGTYSGYIRVADSAGHAAQTGVFTTVVQPAATPLQFVNADTSSLSLTVGGSASRAFSVKGGSGTYSFSFVNTGSGSNPLAFASASGSPTPLPFVFQSTLAGTFSQLGTFKGKVVVSDGSSTIETPELSVTVEAPVAPLTLTDLTPATNPYVDTQGLPWTIAMSAQINGGKQPYTVEFIDTGTIDWMTSGSGGWGTTPTFTPSQGQDVTGYRAYASLSFPAMQTGSSYYIAYGVYQGRIKVTDAAGQVAETDERKFIVDSQNHSGTYMVTHPNAYYDGLGLVLDLGEKQLDPTGVANFSIGLDVSGGQQPYGWWSVAVNNAEQGVITFDGATLGSWMTLPGHLSPQGGGEVTFGYQISQPGIWIEQIMVRGLNGYDPNDNGASLYVVMRVKSADYSPMADGGDIAPLPIGQNTCQSINVSGGSPPYQVGDLTSISVSGGLGSYSIDTSGPVPQICGTLNDTANIPLTLMISDSTGNNINVTRHLRATAQYTQEKVLSFCNNTASPTFQIGSNALGNPTFTVKLKDTDDDGSIDQLGNAVPINFCAPEADITSAGPIASPQWTIRADFAPPHSDEGFSKLTDCGSTGCYERPGHPSLYLGAIDPSLAFWPWEGFFSGVRVVVEKNDHSVRYVSQPFDLTISSYVP